MKTRRIAVVGVILIVAIVVSGVALYSTFLAGDDLPALGLDTPAPSSAASGGSTSTLPAATATSVASSSPGPGASSALGDLAGIWSVASGVAGYRVRETFLQQNADTDAVGRTQGITGSMSISGAIGSLSLDSASLTVNMTTLASDRSQRDGQLTGRAIETDRFPASTFELTGPVALPAGFGSADVAVTLPGKLTLHGVTQDVSIPAQARLEADGTVVVAGSLPILFADYGIEAPNVAGLIAVQDHGGMEFRVVFAKG